MEGLSPVKNIQQAAVISDDVPVNAITSFHNHVATSTPFRRGRSFVTSLYPLPSPILSVIPPSGGKTRSRTGTSRTSLAESGKM